MHDLTKGQKGVVHALQGKALFVLGLEGRCKKGSGSLVKSGYRSEERSHQMVGPQWPIVKARSRC